MCTCVYIYILLLGLAWSHQAREGICGVITYREDPECPFGYTAEPHSGPAG